MTQQSAGWWSRRRAAAVATAFGVVALAVGAIAWTSDEGTVEAVPTTIDNPLVQSATTVAPRPSTTEAPAPTTTASTLPPLPEPEPLPLDERAPTPDVKLGRLEIPKLGLDVPLGVGMTLTAIDRGPSWWPGTAEPGRYGNMVIAGHRVTHSRPFRYLDRLVPGDRIIVTTDQGRFEYEFTEQVIVPPSAIHIADQTWEHRITLFACHPPGSSRYRIVVHGRLLGADGKPVAPLALPPPLEPAA